MRTNWRRSLGLAIAIGALVTSGLGAPAAAGPAPAGWDPAYGPIDLPSPAVNEVFVDPDGRVLSLTGGTDATLRRWNADGTPDVGFGAVAVPGRAAPVAARSVTAAFDLWGTITIISRGSSAASVHRFDDAGAPVTTFGDDGRLWFDDLPADRLLVSTWDRLVLERPTAPGTFHLEVRDSSGEVDSSFADDGALEVACCDPADGPVDVRAFDDEGPGGAWTVAVHGGGGSWVVRLHGDGMVVGLAPVVGSTAEVGVQWLGHAGDQTWVVLEGAGARRVALFGMLLPQAEMGGDGWAGAPAGTMAAPPMVQGSKLVIATVAGTDVTLTRFGSVGLDPSFGVGGSVTAPGPGDGGTFDHTVLGEGGLVAMTSSGRFLTIGQAEWGPGFFNPYSSIPSVLTEITAEGQITRTSRQEPMRVRALLRAPSGDQVIVGTGSSSSVAGVELSPSVRRIARWTLLDPAATVGVVPGLAVAVGAGSLELTWDRPAVVQGQHIVLYDVEVRNADGGDVVVGTSVQGRSASVALPAAGGTYLVDVRAVTAAGPGPWSGAPVIVVPPFASFEAFLAQLAADFSVPAPGPAAIEQVRAAVAAGETEAGYLIRATADEPAWASRLEPVTRLYLAYFGRPPDPSGLRHWMAKRAGGTTVAQISASFARSSEFVRTYGPLTNRAFVELVYDSVLGRPADPSGAAYWTGRLDRRVVSRGQLMASFSESTEHVRTTRAAVDTVGHHWAMLGRVPTADELADWAGPTPIGDEQALAVALLASDEYHDRIG